MIRASDSLTKIPAKLPPADGKISCMICHDTRAPEDPRAHDIISLFLRMPKGGSLLYKSCHTDMTDQFSHPPTVMPPDKLAVFKADGLLTLTRGNKAGCITCHRTHGAPSSHLLRASGGGMLLCCNGPMGQESISHFPHKRYGLMTVMIKTGQDCISCHERGANNGIDPISFPKRNNAHEIFTYKM